MSAYTFVLLDLPFRCICCLKWLWNISDFLQVWTFPKYRLSEKGGHHMRTIVLILQQLMTEVWYQAFALFCSLVLTQELLLHT